MFDSVRHIKTAVSVESVLTHCRRISLRHERTPWTSRGLKQVVTCRISFCQWMDYLYGHFSLHIDFKYLLLLRVTGHTLRYSIKAKKYSKLNSERNLQNILGFDPVKEPSKSAPNSRIERKHY